MGIEASGFTFTLDGEREIGEFTNWLLEQQIQPLPGTLRLIPGKMVCTFAEEHRAAISAWLDANT